MKIEEINQWSIEEFLNNIADCNCSFIIAGNNASDNLKLHLELLEKSKDIRILRNAVIQKSSIDEILRVSPDHLGLDGTEYSRFIELGLCGHSISFTVLSDSVESAIARIVTDLLAKDIKQNVQYALSDVNDTIDFVILQLEVKEQGAKILEIAGVCGVAEDANSLKTELLYKYDILTNNYIKLGNMSEKLQSKIIKRGR